MAENVRFPISGANPCVVVFIVVVVLENVSSTHFVAATIDPARNAVRMMATATCFVKCGKVFTQLMPE